MGSSPGEERIRRILVLLAACLAGGEIGVRLYEGLVVDGEVGALTNFIEQREDHWVLEPDTVVIQPGRHGNVRYRINSLGFRDRDHDTGRAGRRLLFLGDSISFGLTVGDDEPFPRLVEEELNRAASWAERFDVMNLGIFAYTPADSLAVLRHYGRAFRPELIVLQLYMNDFFQGAGGEPPRPTVWQRVVAIKNMVVNRSALWRRVRQLELMLAYRAFHDLRRRHWPGTLNADEPRAILGILREQPNDAKIEGFRATLAIRDLAAEMGVPLFVFLSPHEVQLFEDEHDGINERVAAFAAREGLVFYDPLPDLRADEDPPTLFTDRLHYSARGHRVLAALLLAQLEQRFAWPGPPRGRVSRAPRSPSSRARRAPIGRGTRQGGRTWPARAPSG